MELEHIFEVRDRGEAFAEARVDRESLLIQNVTLLGKVSKNGRTYSDQAMKDAARLYEGVPFFIDHPTDRELRERKGVRSVLDLAGKIRNPRVSGDRVRGDIQLLDREPTKGLIFAIAEQMPDAAGNSHRALGQIRRTDNGEVVESLDRVFAVELVTDPATTEGLFESCREEAMMREAKGEEGKGTGGDARSLIRGLMDKGLTQEEIGNSVDRSAGVIGAILSGEIMNPPPSLISALRSLNSRTKNKPTKESTMEYRDITLAALTEQRGDLVTSIQKAISEGAEVEQMKADNKTLREENDTLKATNAERDRLAMIDTKLAEAKLPETLVTDVFKETLAEAKDEKRVDELIEDRKGLAKSLKGGPRSTETKLDESLKGGDDEAFVLTPAIMTEAVDGLFN